MARPGIRETKSTRKSKAAASPSPSKPAEETKLPQKRPRAEESEKIELGDERLSRCPHSEVGRM